MATAKDVIAMAKEHGAEIADLRFSDLPGLMQHFSVPISELTDSVFDEGIGFDGSSIRGFQEIQESDMLLVPDPDTAFMDPFTQHPTINVAMNGELFQSLGIAGTTGTVSLYANGGTATGNLRAELSAKPGELTFSVSPTDPQLELRVWPISGAATPRFRARGRTVVVGRSASGDFYVKGGGL